MRTRTGHSSMVTVAMLALIAGIFAVVSAVAVTGDAGATVPGREGKIAYANGGIWVVGPGGGSPTRLTSNANDTDPSWSPDGKRISFTRFNGCQSETCVFGDIWVMDADGTDQRLVTEGFDPSWSPDGKKLAYESCARNGTYPCDDDKRNISTVNQDGSGRADLTSGMKSACNSNVPSPETDPTWSPDGTSIAFVSTRDNCRYEVYKMSASGAGPTRISDAAEEEADYAPSWAPNGDDIIFTRIYADGTSKAIYVDADGILGGIVYNENASGMGAVWSPENDGIVYSTRPGGVVTTIGPEGQPKSLGVTGFAPDWQSVNTRPKVLSPKPAPGSKTKDATPIITATVRDAETNLKKSDVTLTVDGKRVSKFTYSAATDRLTYKSAALKPGNHTVRIMAKDERGESVVKTWTFKVIS